MAEDFGLGLAEFSVKDLAPTYLNVAVESKETSGVLCCTGKMKVARLAANGYHIKGKKAWEFFSI